MDGFEVSIDGGDGSIKNAKPLELRMVSVTTGTIQKNLTREQCLTPECCQTCRIEVPRM